LTLSLAGCGSSSVKIGWLETSGVSHKTARYETFSGSEQATNCADAGQTITLDYTVTVSKGTLTFVIEKSDNPSYWENTFSQDASDTITIVAEDKRCYSLQITGKQAGGSYNIAWSIES
jgi:hypothetical protein